MAGIVRKVYCSPKPRPPIRHVCSLEWKEEKFHYSCFGQPAISYPESSRFLVGGATPGTLWGHQFHRYFWLAMPFLTEIEYQNKFLHFHWLLGISESFMGSWWKLALRGMFSRNTSKNRCLYLVLILYGDAILVYRFGTSGVQFFYKSSFFSLEN